MVAFARCFVDEYVTVPKTSCWYIRHHSHIIQIMSTHWNTWCFQAYPQQGAQKDLSGGFNPVVKNVANGSLSQRREQKNVWNPPPLYERTLRAPRAIAFMSSSVGSGGGLKTSLRQHPSVELVAAIEVRARLSLYVGKPQCHWLLHWG